MNDYWYYIASYGQTLFVQGIINKFLLLPVSLIDDALCEQGQVKQDYYSFVWPPHRPLLHASLIDKAVREKGPGQTRLMHYYKLPRQKSPSDVIHPLYILREVASC